MKKIIGEKLPIERFELPEEALALVEQMNEPYKAELIRDLPRTRSYPSTGRASSRTCALGRIFPIREG